MQSWPSLSTRLATPEQRRSALGFAAAICAVTALFFPWAQRSWPSFGAFVPAYQTAVIFDYAVCAYLVFGHYRATGSRALLHLGSGFVYTALVMVAQFLSFPGLFAPGGALPGGAQTTIWLWFFWHLGPVVSILAYALSEWRHPAYLDRQRSATILKALGVVALAAAATVFTVTVLHDWLPVLDEAGDFRRITSTGVAPALQLLTLGTLALIWWYGRFQTVLQVWIGVSLVALLCDNAITMAGGTRLSVGWYMGRFNALISASMLLFMYLAEVNRVVRRAMDRAEKAVQAQASLMAKVDQARLDALTQLPGRSLFFELAGSAIQQSAASHQSVALLFLDLDGFKQVNDTLGHEKGDLVLAQVAAVLKAALRDSDVPGRIGGDEFAVVLSAAPAAIDITARQVAKRIISMIEKIGHGVGCSVGIEHGPAQGMQLEVALQRADQAMYMVKHDGKNGYRVFDAGALPSPMAA
jgi:diguanylate cyclase (GGDEF)-like protein